MVEDKEEGLEEVGGEEGKKHGHQLHGCCEFVPLCESQQPPSQFSQFSHIAHFLFILAN